MVLLLTSDNSNPTSAKNCGATCCAYQLTPPNSVLNWLFSISSVSPCLSFFFLALMSMYFSSSTYFSWDKAYEPSCSLWTLTPHCMRSSHSQSDQRYSALMDSMIFNHLLLVSSPENRKSSTWPDTRPISFPFCCSVQQHGSDQHLWRPSWSKYVLMERYSTQAVRPPIRNTLDELVSLTQVVPWPPEFQGMGYTTACWDNPVTEEFAPDTSPFQVWKPIAAAMASCICLVCLVVVGDVVARPEYQGSMYPSKTARAFGFLPPSGRAFQVRIQRIFTASDLLALYPWGKAPKAFAAMKLFTSICFAPWKAIFSSGVSLRSETSTAFRFKAVLK